MKKTIKIFLILMQLNLLGYGQQVVTDLIFFEQNKYELSENYKKLIDNLLDKLNTKEILSIEISGHTNSDGSNLYNKNLSIKRAITVKKYLISKGVPLSKIKYKYFGEENPLESNDNEEGKQKNRRAEIIIKYNDLKESAKNNSINTAGENKISKTTLKFLNKNNDIQHFTVSPQRNIIIKGKHGTIVKFHKYSFIDKYGEIITDDVNIELTEIYTKSEMIRHNIQTVSDGKLLETGGMIFLNVTIDNSQVSLRKETEFDIEFQTKSKKSDMSIFLGETSGTSLNWRKPEISYYGEGTDPNQETLNKYIFQSRKLGWINCDRFTSDQYLTDLNIDITDTSGVSFCLIFNNINSVMNVNSNDHSIKFKSIPIGETATIIAFKINGEEISFTSKKITIENNQTIKLILKKINADEFQNRLLELD